MPTYSTSPGVTREYFNALRWLRDEARGATERNHIRRVAAMSVIQAVTAVEVLMNLWFRAVVEDEKDEQKRCELLRDLDRKIPLEQRLSTWPKKYLGRDMNLRDGPGGAFVALKNHRNSIIHFSTTHESVRSPQMIMHGLADTTAYDELDSSSADAAVITAEAFVTELFRIRGFDSATSEQALLAWIGKQPSAPNIDTAIASVPPWIAAHVQR
jgi:hypothetical protein